MEILVPSSKRDRDTMAADAFWDMMANLPLEEQEMYISRRNAEGQCEIEVTLMFNGHEVSFKTVLELWRKNLDYLLRQEAEKLIEDRMGQINLSFFSEIEQKVRDMVQAKFPEIKWKDE